MGLSLLHIKSSKTLATLINSKILVVYILFNTQASPSGFFITDKTRAARVLNASKYSSIFNGRFDQS